MVKSFKGREIDLSQILESQGNIIAAGNMRVNARGDLLGKRGKILKTREQLENEYVKNNPDAVKMRETNKRGFNMGLREYSDQILADDLLKEEPKPEDPFKETAIHNPNLSTKKDDKVKFSDLVKSDDAPAVSSLDNLPIEDSFELDGDPEPKDTKKKK